MAHNLIFTPHPLILDGQERMVMEFRPDETLYSVLDRHLLHRFPNETFLVSVAGRHVPVQLWHKLRLKDGQHIEVRSAVNDRQIWAYIAIAVLSYFTLGLGGIAGGSFLGLTGFTGYLAAAATFVVGAALINKVLGPKPSSPDTNRDSVYNLSGQRNQARPYEPFGLVLGEVFIAPDIASNAYTWYEGDDQYLGMILTPGLNCAKVGVFYNGDALLSSYEGVTVTHNGYASMESVPLPLYSDADSQAGGTLEAGVWVQRTTSTNTRIIQVDIEYTLFDKTSKGKDKKNQETVVVEYSPIGLNQWAQLASKYFVNSDMDTHRYSITSQVTPGQYDVRVRRLGNDTDGSGATINMTFTQMVSVQVDPTDYTGIPRTAVQMKATGQLNNAPDELRTLATAKPMPYWDGLQWTTATEGGADGLSNPGAQGLQYVRGFYDERNKLVAGIGLNDTMIDIPSWQAFMIHCAANNFRYDFWVRDKRTREEQLDAILLAGFGKKSWATGKLGVVFAADEQPYTKVINMSTINAGSFQIDYQLDNAADGIEYTYFDRTTRANATLRIPAPGVDEADVVNPAALTGEGVGDEAHAAMLARYHMAQSAYQWRDISLSTDIEHITYRNLDKVQLQHDLTQWGFGGQLVGVSIAGNVVTLQLDSVVRPPASGNAWIGLRIPGELTYRIFQVVTPSEETDTLNLIGEWPADARVPGDADDNPPWDTIWIYDFKATPGFSARVVSIIPDDEIKSATITMVPEGPEFWDYVKTGNYVPSQPGTALLTKPIVSKLRVTEAHVVQGDTVYTNLSATWDVAGPYARAVVLAAEYDGELAEVAQTATRTATWRIDHAGVYVILIRPYGPDGSQGVPVSIEYATQGADAKPNNFDQFDVVEQAGGIRKYTWGYAPETIQPANLAGAEIRYIGGTVQNPDWDQMQPIGDDGFHTAAFEAAVPVAGTYTFSIRARNTNGELSIDALSIVKTLSKNVGEIFTDVEQAQNELNLQITQEIQRALAAEADVANNAAADASAKADAAREAAIAHADVIGAQVADIIGADEWVTGKDYPKGDLVKHNGALYRALRANNSVEPGTSANDWQLIGNYDSLGEAVAGSIAMGTANASAIQAEAQQLDAVQARMPTGSGTLATQASVSDEATARATADTALGQRTASVEARMPAGNGTLATDVQVVSEQQARATADTALGTRVDGVVAKLPADGGQAASQATVTSLQQAMTAADSALGLRVDGVVASLGNSGNNMLLNPSWNNGFANWLYYDSSYGTANEQQYGPYMYVGAASGGKAINQDVTNVASGDYVFSADVYRNSAAGNVRIDVNSFNGSTNTAGATAYSDASVVGRWQRIWVKLTVPAGTTRLTVRCIVENTNATNSFRRTKLERGSTPTVYSDDVTINTTASATSLLQAQVADPSTGLAANASAITTVSAKNASSPNILPNGGFENGTTFWNQLNGLVPNDSGAGWGRILSGGTPTNAQSDVYSNAIPAIGGVAYTFSGDAVFIATSNQAQLTFDLIFYDANGNGTVAPGITRTASFDFDANDNARSTYKATAVAPANTTQIRVRMRWSSNGATIQAIGFRQMKLERGSVATRYSDEASLVSTASATQSLSVSLNSLTGTVNAQYTLALQVNGYISGIRSVNTGTTSTFDVVADTFRIVAPNGGQRYEYSGNNFRVYDSNGVLRMRGGVW